jgi:thioesterase domain-containing protein
MQPARDGARSADVIRRGSGARQFSSLIAVQPHGSNPPLFWVHGDYSDIVLRRHLPADQPVYGLLHQARDGTAARYQTVETIAAHYLEEIQTVQERGPYLLGGFSFGGTVAFEMAQQLTRRGEKVALLFLIDSRFPGDETADSSDPAGIRVAMRAKIRRHVDEISTLSLTDTLAYVRVRAAAHLRRIAHGFTRPTKSVVCRWHVWTGRPIPLSLRSFYMLQIYGNARRKYVTQPYDGDMVYIQCAADSGGHAARWRSVIGGAMQVCDVPGEHLAIVREPFATLWVETLKTQLDAVRAATRSNRDGAVRR